MYPPVTYADSYVQRRDPDRAVKPPPLELSHQDGDHMRRLAVLTANHRCLTATARKAVFFCHGSLCCFRLSHRQTGGQACPRQIVYETIRLLERDRQWSASRLCMIGKRNQP